MGVVSNGVYITTRSAFAVARTIAAASLGARVLWPRDRSLRGNAVLRWEYRPGSTLFVVWTQSRFAELTDPTFAPLHYLGHELLGDRPTNVLLVKMNYWLSL